MNVELTQQQVQILMGLLQARIATLRTEARHTDDARYHDDLLRLEDDMRRLLRNLEEVAGVERLA